MPSEKRNLSPEEKVDQRGRKVEKNTGRLFYSGCQMAGEKPLKNAEEKKSSSGGISSRRP